MLLHELKLADVRQEIRPSGKMLATYLISKHRQGCQASTLTHLQGHRRPQALLPDQALSG